MLSPEQVNDELMHAIRTCRPGRVEYLLNEEHAPVHFHHGPTATTPFLEAVANGLVDVAESLRHRGADIQARDNQGKNGFLTVVWRYSRTLFANDPGYSTTVYDKTRLLDYLLYCGVDSDARTLHGDDALGLARRLLDHEGRITDRVFLDEARQTVGYLKALASPKGRKRIQLLHERRREIEARPVRVGMHAKEDTLLHIL